MYLNHCYLPTPHFWSYCHQHRCCQPRRLPKLNKMPSFPKLEPIMKKKRKVPAKSKQCKTICNCGEPSKLDTNIKETSSSVQKHNKNKQNKATRNDKSKSPHISTNETNPNFVKEYKDKIAHDLQSNSSEAYTKASSTHFVKKYQDLITGSLVPCSTKTCPHLIKPQKENDTINLITERSLDVTVKTIRNLTTKQKETLNKKAKFEISKKCTNETCRNLNNNYETKVRNENKADNTEQPSSEPFTLLVKKFTNSKTKKESVEDPKTCKPSNCSRLKKTYNVTSDKKQLSETEDTSYSLSKESERSYSEKRNSLSRLEKKGIKSRLRNTDTGNLESKIGESSKRIFKKHEKSCIGTIDAKKSKICTPTNCPELLKIFEKTNKQAPKTIDLSTVSTSKQELLLTKKQKEIKQQNLTSEQSLLSECSGYNSTIKEKELQQQQNSTSEPMGRRRAMVTEMPNLTSSYTTNDSDSQFQFGYSKPLKGKPKNCIERPKTPKIQTMKHTISQTATTDTETLHHQKKRDAQKKSAKEEVTSEISIEQLNKLGKNHDSKVNRKTNIEYSYNSSSKPTNNKSSRSISSRSPVHFENECICRSPQSVRSVVRVRDSRQRLADFAQQQKNGKENSSYKAFNHTKALKKSKRDSSTDCQLECVCVKSESDLGFKKKMYDKDEKLSVESRQQTSSNELLSRHKFKDKPSSKLFSSHKTPSKSCESGQKIWQEISSTPTLERVANKRITPSFTDNSKLALFFKEESWYVSTDTIEDLYDLKRDSSGATTEIEKRIRTTSLFSDTEDSLKDLNSNTLREKLHINNTKNTPIKKRDKMYLDITASVRDTLVLKNNEEASLYNERLQKRSDVGFERLDKNIQTQIEVKVASTQTSQIYEKIQIKCCCNNEPENEQSPKDCENDSRNFKPTKSKEVKSEREVRSPKYPEYSKMSKYHMKTQIHTSDRKAKRPQEAREERGARHIRSSLLKADSVLLTKLLHTKRNQRADDSSSTLSECFCTKKQTDENMREMSKRDNKLEKKNLMMQKKYQSRKVPSPKDSTSTALSTIELKPKQKESHKKEENVMQKPARRYAVREQTVRTTPESAHRQQKYETSGLEISKCFCKKFIPNCVKALASGDTRRHTLMNSNNQKISETDNLKRSTCTCSSKDSYYNQTYNDDKSMREMQIALIKAEHKQAKDMRTVRSSRESARQSDSLFFQETLESTVKPETEKRPDKRSKDATEKKDSLRNVEGTKEKIETRELKSYNKNLHGKENQEGRSTREDRNSKLLSSAKSQSQIGSLEQAFVLQQPPKPKKQRPSQRSNEQIEARSALKISTQENIGNLQSLTSSESQRESLERAFILQPPPKPKPKPVRKTQSNQLSEDSFKYPTLYQEFSHIKPE